jgi:hypothetical protein
MAADVTPVMGATASAVAPLLTGPVLEGTVLGAFSRAVIVGLHTESGPRVVSLLARGAAAVPNGVRLVGTGAALHGVQVGAQALVGAGRVRIGQLDIEVARTWNSRVPRIDPDPGAAASLAAAASRAERGVPDVPIHRLAAALTGSGGFDRSDADGDLDAAVDGLVGLGRGLTPGGDDVLAGLLTGLHATGRAGLATQIGQRVLHGITERTTLLSADLLRLAAAGHACLEALAVLRAIHQPPSVSAAPRHHGAGAPMMEPINGLLSIGHTSGADLATGLVLGLGCDREAARTAAGQGAR